MGVNANALETYDSITIREDLVEAENMISPVDTPFISKICGRNKATNKYHEWVIVELASANNANRVMEGEDIPTIVTANLGLRRGNYTQISDKVIKVTDTSQVVDGVANIEKMSKQIAYKLKELKRDKETMLLLRAAANPGASGTARQAAGFPAFIRTNFTGGTGSPVAPTLSGTTTGYPNAAGTPGTTSALTETRLNTSIQQSWTEGGEPKYVLVSPTAKRLISTTFVANSTKYKDADDKKLISAIDYYESDFGTVQIVPDRHIPVGECIIIDPEYVKISDLQPTRQFDLARTGHSDNKMIQSEYTLEVGNEKAHAIIAAIA